MTTVTTFFDPRHNEQDAYRAPKWSAMVVASKFNTHEPQPDPKNPGYQEQPPRLGKIFGDCLTSLGVRVQYNSSHLCGIFPSSKAVMRSTT